MATFNFFRTDTGAGYTVSGHGKRHTLAEAIVRLGCTAEQVHLVHQTANRPGSVKPHRRFGGKSREERRSRARGRQPSSYGYRSSW
ncbi:MAG: hypothetical protein V1856_01930 [Candidatus Liptonbacteria bacterium]